MHDETGQASPSEEPRLRLCRLDFEIFFFSRSGGCRRVLRPFIQSGYREGGAQRAYVRARVRALHHGGSGYRLQCSTSLTLSVVTYLQSLLSSTDQLARAIFPQARDRPCTSLWVEWRERGRERLIRTCSRGCVSVRGRGSPAGRGSELMEPWHRSCRRLGPRPISRIPPSGCLQKWGLSFPTHVMSRLPTRWSYFTSSGSVGFLFPLNTLVSGLVRKVVQRRSADSRGMEIT